jgi:uncharacterized membrane protein
VSLVDTYSCRGDDTIRYTESTEKILKLLAEADKDKLFSNKEIGNKTGLSKKSVIRHLNRLEENEIIDRNTDTRPSETKLKENARWLVRNLSSRTKDKRIMKNTSIENMSSKVNYEDNYGVCKITAFRNLGEKSTIEGSMEIQDKNYPIDDVAGRLLSSIEENIEDKLQDIASRMFEEKVDNYDVRRGKTGNSVIGVVKDEITEAIVESSRFRIEKKKGKQYKDPVDSLSSKSIKSALLNHKAAVSYLGGDAEEATDEFLDRFKLNEEKTLSEVEKDLEQVWNHIDVFTKEEEKLIQEILEEITEIRRGELMITLTRSSAGNDTAKDIT